MDAPAFENRPVDHEETRAHCPDCNRHVLARRKPGYRVGATDLLLGVATCGVSLVLLSLPAAWLGGRAPFLCPVCGAAAEPVKLPLRLSPLRLVAVFAAIAVVPIAVIVALAIAAAY